MVYQWKVGSHHKCDAKVAGKVCETLAGEGRLTPKDLVEESRPDDAPLHGEFEWDDRAAAEAYRESQARYIIRSIEVVVQHDGEDVGQTRAFVALQDGGPCEYTPIDVVMSDDSRRQELLRRALSELACFKQKYRSLTELSRVFDEIDQLQLTI